MGVLLLLLVLVPQINSLLFNHEREEYCRNITCGNSFKSVCGIREEGAGVRLRVFQDECKLMKYGCEVEEEKAYGLINMEYCEETFSIKTTKKITLKTSCIQDNCDHAKPICALREDGRGVRVKLFTNECQMLQHNCENNLQFSMTDAFLCKGMAPINSIKEKKANTLVVVDASSFYTGNVNSTIDNFFAATHLVNMPLREVDLNETTRRRILKNVGPVVIYKPWVKIPANASEDIYHRPTLASCYHRCPEGKLTYNSHVTSRIVSDGSAIALKPLDALGCQEITHSYVPEECPDTYAPVCAVPGMKAREPSLMFKNHCFMDIAQCKMNWEDIGPTAVSSAYIDSPFIFCMGETLSRMFVMLPLIRTLQHMGRLRKKGKFHQRLRNMRFDNIAFNKVMG